MWGSSPGKSEGSSRGNKGASSPEKSSLPKVEENLPSPPNKAAVRLEKSEKWKSIDQKSKRFFEIAGNAAKTEDGEESMIDKIMIEKVREAQQQKGNGESMLKRKSKEIAQATSVMQILQQMVTHDDMLGSDSSEDDDDEVHDLMDNSTFSGGSTGVRTSKSLLKSIRSVEDLLGPDAEEFIRRIIMQEFPKSINPTLSNLINVGPARNGSGYKPSEWVEILGQDMKYRLEMVTRVLKLAPIEWDWNAPENEGKDPEWLYYYHAGDKRMIQADEVRSPKEGLVRVFGQRPWIWQQWACLKIESTLRFHEGHQNDFMSHDVPKHALDLWDRWLHDPRNAEFCKLFYDDRVGDRGRYELITHIMSPFNLLDKIKEDRDQWNFEEESRFSVFTYLGMLGSGYIVPIAIVILQAAIPGILVWNLLDSAAQASAEGDCVSLSLFGYSNTCPLNPVAQSMGLVVLFFYLFKIVPDTLNSFYETAGTGSSVYSRLVSLRREIWFRGDDRPEQQLGFRLDIYMNTGYVNILFMLNMFIIINSDDAFEILLNALAFEFVINLDESFVNSVWWDPKKRWIMAGSMELVLQSVLLPTVLSNPERFEEVFGVPRDLALAAADGDVNLLKNNVLADTDQENTSFMTNDEVVKFLCKKVAIESNNVPAIVEYQKPRVFFGAIVRLMRTLSGVKGGGAYDRYPAFRTWSRWDKLLYLASVPSLSKIFCEDNFGNTVVSAELSSITSTKKAPFKNLDEDYLAGKKEMEVFGFYFVRVLTLQYFIHFCSPAWKKRKPFSFLLRVFDSMLQWLSFFIQIVFPLYTFFCVLGLAANLIGITSPISHL